MQLTLIKKNVEVPGVQSFIFRPDALLTWKAGQYLHYLLPHEGADDRGIERWFTVASAPFEGTPMITTRHASGRSSSFKERLFLLEPGNTIDADGPEGEFTVDDPSGTYVFLAGGIGITPFHSILKEADHAGTKLTVTLLYANRDSNVPFQQELDTFVEHNPNLKIHYLTSPQQIDVVTIQRLVPDLPAPTFYISGPEPMVKSLAEDLTHIRVPESRIKLDDFPGYEAHEG